MVPGVTEGSGWPSIRARCSVLAGVLAGVLPVAGGVLGGVGGGGPRVVFGGPGGQARRAVLVGPGSAHVNGVDVVTNALVRVLVQPVHEPVGRHAELNAAIRDDFGGGVREALAGGAGRHATCAVGGVVLAVVLAVVLRLVLGLVLGLAGLMVGLMDGSDGGGQAR